MLWRRSMTRSGFGLSFREALTRNNSPVGGWGHVRELRAGSVPGAVGQAAVAVPVTSFQAANRTVISRWYSSGCCADQAIYHRLRLLAASLTTPHVVSKTALLHCQHFDAARIFGHPFGYVSFYGHLHG